MESKCEKYINENENIFRNGYYSVIPNLHIFGDPYNGKVPKYKNILIISYNSGGQTNLKVIDTVNVFDLKNIIGKILDDKNNISNVIISKHLYHAERVDKNIFDLIKNKNVIIVDRSIVVCSSFIDDKEEPKVTHEKGGEVGGLNYSIGGL